MPTLGTLAVGVSVLALATALGPPPEPSQDPLEGRLRRLIEETQGEDVAARDAAHAELRQLLERSWPECYTISHRTKDKDLSLALQNELGVTRAKDADVFVLGKITELEHAQGGVVDHHDLIAHFERPFLVWKGQETLGDRRLAPDMLLLARGTHRDTWLCELMKRELSRGPSDVVLALKERTLTYPIRDGGPDTAFWFFEFQVLPASAEAALEDITGICIKRPR